MTNLCCNLQHFLRTSEPNELPDIASHFGAVSTPRASPVIYRRS